MARRKTLTSSLRHNLIVRAQALYKLGSVTTFRNTTPSLFSVCHGGHSNVISIFLLPEQCDSERVVQTKSILTGTGQ